MKEIIIGLDVVNVLTPEDHIPQDQEIVLFMPPEQPKK